MKPAKTVHGNTVRVHGGSGERPAISHDTPGGAGIYTMDDIYTWNGDPRRFAWKYIETKEMLVPYNNYSFDLATTEELYTKNFINPKYLRFELHRVHVYEATLNEGSRHAYGKRVFYQDEDSWCNLIQDKYDTRGTLWRTQFQQNLIAYPAAFMYTRCQLYYDFQVTYYSVTWAVNDIENPFDYKRYPTGWFTPEHLRREGRR